MGALLPRSLRPPQKCCLLGRNFYACVYIAPIFSKINKTHLPLYWYITNIVDFANFLVSKNFKLFKTNALGDQYDWLLFDNLLVSSSTINSYSLTDFLRVHSFRTELNQWLGNITSASKDLWLHFSCTSQLTLDLRFFSSSVMRYNHSLIGAPQLAEKLMWLMLYLFGCHLRYRPR